MMGMKMMLMEVKLIIVDKSLTGYELWHYKNPMKYKKCQSCGIQYKYLFRYEIRVNEVLYLGLIHSP